MTDRHDAAVTLVQYSAQWPLEYEREAGRIRSALSELVLLLEHVGSTSVPGLVAKPVIDICLDRVWQKPPDDFVAGD
jgi:GrpB-like predicted nucleotidyltransferase (UPF0157 family)